MKDLFSFIIILFLFLALLEYLNKEKKRKKQIENYQLELPQVDKTPTTEKVTKLNSHKGDIIVRNLGQIDDGDIEFASDVIRNFGFNPVVYPGISIPRDIIVNDWIDARKFVLYPDDKTRTIYLTEMELKEDSLDLRGYTTLNGTTIVVRSERDFMNETIKHEIGHTLGLEHCDEISCIMAINNDEWDSGTFCQKCKDILELGHFN